jgi:hypothetical protein
VGTPKTCWPTGWDIVRHRTVGRGGSAAAAAAVAAVRQVLMSIIAGGAGSCSRRPKSDTATASSQPRPGGARASTLGPPWYTISILTDICRCLAGWQLDRYRSIFSTVVP